MDTLLRTAINNAAEPTGSVVALNAELPEDGSVPEWVQLVPSGPRIEGIDGRTWKFSETEAEAVVDAFRSRGRELVIDWEHASEIRAPAGQEAPAAGWIRELEIRDGALWGRVAWTERAAEQIRRREYRFLSPVFLFTPTDRRVVRLTSAGLTNQPNFSLSALNHEQQEESAVNWKALCKRLGLSEEATEEQVLSALDTLNGKLETAQNSQQNPSLDKFVPRSDYDTAVQRATNAEQKLQEKEQEQHEAEIDKAVNAALEAGKITPATVEYHKAQCRTEGGLDRFNKFVEAAPSITADSGLGDRGQPEGSDKALNAETQQIASMFGNSEEDLKQYGGATHAQ